MVSVNVEHLGAFVSLGHPAHHSLPTPLFVSADGATSALDMLLRRLRLSAIKKERDVFQIVLDSVVDVRARFYRRLGQTRVQQILGMVSNISSDTPDETMRAVAEVTEVQWVRWFLLRRLKVLFQDASAGAREDWQELGLVRDEDRLEMELKYLWRDIDENLDLLAGAEQLGGEVDARAADLGPITPNLPVGSSTWPPAKKALWLRTHH